MDNKQVKQQYPWEEEMQPLSNNGQINHRSAGPNNEFAPTPYEPPSFGAANEQGKEPTPRHQSL